MGKKDDKNIKTNAIRLLEQAAIPFVTNHYDVSDNRLDGVSVAKKIGQDPSYVFKTLVCRGASKAHFVFVIPVSDELNLKKAAKAAGEKSIAMIPQKELLPTTGYIHGGCSPVGMKKLFPTFIDETALLFDTIFVSGGKIGIQVGLNPETLCEFIHGSFHSLTDI